MCGHYCVGSMTPLRVPVCSDSKDTTHTGEEYQSHHGLIYFSQVCMIKY